MFVHFVFSMILYGCYTFPNTVPFKWSPQKHKVGFVLYMYSRLAQYNFRLYFHSAVLFYQNTSGSLYMFVLLFHISCN